MSNQSNRRSRVSNNTSALLNSEETAVLNRLIGSRCTSLATTVAQVVVAPRPYNQWKLQCTGVLTFVKDNPKRSYYIRVYDIKTGGLIWEQEVYNQFKYHTKQPFFHTFEADTSPAGLNFANEDEAYVFARAVQEKMRQRKSRRDERRKQAAHAGGGAPSARHARSATARKADNAAAPPQIPTMTVNIPDTSSGSSTLRKKDKDKKKDKGKKKLTKADIGTPSNFKHVGHVGWDPETGFDMEQLDPDVKQLFTDVGVSEEQLKDKDTAAFLYDFIEQQGGIDKIKQERQNMRRELPPPPPPATARDMPPAGMAPAPPLPSRNMGSAPPHPPPPSRSGAAPPPPPPPSRSPAAAPPPPPPSRSRAGAPPPPPPSSRAPPPPMAAPPPPPPSNAPAPPPPPPMGGGGAPPPPPPPPPSGGVPPPPPPPSGGGGGGSRGALLSQIQGGASLKHVNQEERKAPPPTDSRSCLMDEIRGGARLNKVDTSQLERPKSDTPTDGIAGALARALAARAKGVQGDASSEDEEEDDDDSDWD